MSSSRLEMYPAFWIMCANAFSMDTMACSPRMPTLRPACQAQRAIAPKSAAKVTQCFRCPGRMQRVPPCSTSAPACMLRPTGCRSGVDRLRRLRSGVADGVEAQPVAFPTARHQAKCLTQQQQLRHAAAQFAQNLEAATHGGHCGLGVSGARSGDQQRVAARRPHQVFLSPTGPTFMRAAIATGMAMPFHGDPAFWCLVES